MRIRERLPVSIQNKKYTRKLIKASMLTSVFRLGTN